MTAIVREIEIARDADTAWSVVGDLARYDRLLVGISRWEPRGPGRYWVLMQVGSVAAGGEVDVTLDRGERRVAWQSLRGTRHAATWQVHDEGPGRCRLTLRVDYQLVGPLGGVATRLARPIVVRNLDASLETTRHVLEYELNAHEAEQV